MIVAIYIRLIVCALATFYALVNGVWYAIIGQWGALLGVLLVSGLVTMAIAPSADQMNAWSKFLEEYKRQ